MVTTAPRPIAWITGASSGIGRALAIALSRRGWTVAASARNVAALDTLAAEAVGPGHILPFPLDVTDLEATRHTVAAIEGLGPIALAVLDAGMHIPMSAVDFSAASARAVLEVNYMGVVHGLEAILPRLRGRKSGTVAVVASVAGYRGLPTAAAYGPSKAALINLCESLQPDLAAEGVRVALINPGFVRTPMTDPNPFPMPFIVSPEWAAERIAKRLVDRPNGFEITFPWPFSIIVKTGRLLPYALYLRIARRIRPNE